MKIGILHVGRCGKIQLISLRIFTISWLSTFGMRLKSQFPIFNSSSQFNENPLLYSGTKSLTNRNIFHLFIFFYFFKEKIFLYVCVNIQKNTVDYIYMYNF